MGCLGREIKGVKHDKLRSVEMQAENVPTNIATCLAVFDNVFKTVVNLYTLVYFQLKRMYSYCIYVFPSL